MTAADLDAALIDVVVGWRGQSIACRPAWLAWQSLLPNSTLIRLNGQCEHKTQMCLRVENTIATVCKRAVNTRPDVTPHTSTTCNDDTFNLHDTEI